MACMTASFLVGVVFGLVISPIIEYLLLKFLTHKGPKPPIYRTILRPTQKQKDLLNASKKACTDMNWFNTALQRLFIELSQSYAFKDKLKKTMLKKIKKISKVIQITIDEIDIGVECPVLSNIRVLSENEMVKIAESFKAARQKKDKVNLDEELVNDISLIETETNGEKTSSDGDMENNSVIEEIITGNVSFEEDDEVDFDNIKYYFDLEYSGKYVLKTTVQMPGVAKMPISFTLHYLKGPVIVRLPAKMNHTRFEISILNIDRLEFKIDCDSMNKYIKKTVSGMMHKFFILFFKKTHVYPSFYSQYLPNVIPSYREVKYPYKSLRSESEAAECFDYLLLVISMDYRMTKVMNDIIFRKTNYYVNNTKRKVLMSDFSIRDHIKRYGENNETDLAMTLIDDALVESFFKCLILDLDIFRGCIRNFKGVEFVCQYSNYAKINLHFEDSIYPFNRFINRDSVIFQSDSSNEFFAFRIRSLQCLEVFSYVQNHDYTINDKRITRFKSKIELNNITSMREEHKEMITSNKNSMEVFDEENKYQSINKIYNAIITDNVIDIDNADLKTKKIAISQKINVSYDIIIKDISIRLKLVFDTFVILETTGDEEFTKTKIMHKGFHRNIISLIKNNIVVDVVDQKRILCFNLEKSSIKLYYNQQIVSTRYHSFIYTTKLIERYLRYKEDTKLLFESQINMNRFEKDFKLEKTSLYVELQTIDDEEMYFYLYDRTTRKYLVEKLKLIGTSSITTKVIVPVFKRSTIMLHIRSKSGYLNNSLKVYTNDNAEFLNEKMIQTKIELSKKKRFELAFDGLPDYSLYWDFSETNLNCFLNDGSAISICGTGSNLLQKKKYAVHMLNRNKEKLTTNMVLGMFKIDH